MTVIILSKTASNLIPCVEAVRKHEPTAKIIIVDDGLDMGGIDACTDDGCWMCRMDPIKRIPGVTPFVFARNVNVGIESAREPIDVTTCSEEFRRFERGPYDDVILLNDDALLKTPGGFFVMLQALTDHPEYGILSATTNLAGNPRQYPQGVGLRAERDTVAFVCVAIPRRTINLVGLLDERFTTYGWEDNDYCRRVKDAGLKIGIHDGCFVDHASLHSTFRGDPRAAGDIAAGRKIYEAKWGRQ